MTDLTKWPRLLVVGAPVTADQAAEIIVRTTEYPLCLNDRAWEEVIADEVGTMSFGDELGDHKAALGLRKLVFAELGVLELRHLHNQQIGSAWIGGPHGWVDWDGRVGCSTWNIGKYPTHEEVGSDLRAIAAAFPYLSMHAQLVAHEGQGDVVASWRVTAGAVFRNPLPEPPIRPIDELSQSGLMARMTSPIGERGCTVEQLRRGIELAHAHVASDPS